MIDHFESDDNHIYYTLGLVDNEPVQKISKDDLFEWAWQHHTIDEAPWTIGHFRIWCNENWYDLLKDYVKQKTK